VAARGEPADAGSVCGCNDHDRRDLPPALGTRKASFVSTGDGLCDLTARHSWQSETATFANGSLTKMIKARCTCSIGP
jgi:hypothetical protein